jgi:amino-acid N-acetyltransferase
MRTTRPSAWSRPSGPAARTAATRLRHGSGEASPKRAEETDARRQKDGRHIEPELRLARPDDAAVIHRLIAENLEASHLLPRDLADIRRHAERFSVVMKNGRLVGAAELAPLSRTVAEVRSLVVSAKYRGAGLGTLLVEEIKRRTRVDGFLTLCAFTHQPAHFVRLGFSIVPHQWLPEKIATDCHACPLFRRCGQYAMLVTVQNEAHAGAHRIGAASLQPVLS